VPDILAGLPREPLMTPHTDPIARPRLARLAEDVLRARLSLLIAPAGSGKTVLLRQWTQALADHAIVVRIDLAFAHNNPPMLRAELARAVAEELPALGWDPEGPITPDDLPQFVAAAGSAARAHPELPLVIVFDDLQEIADASVLGVLEAGIAQLPEDVHLVFSSRMPTSFLLGQLRARGRVLEVGPYDLAFTVGEVAELAIARGAEVDAAALVDETHGWVAAVVLALAQRRAPALAIAEFLDEELLAGLPPEPLAFLFDTAALAEITAGAADELRESDDAERMLADLERRGRFPVRAADGSAVWRNPPAVRAHLDARAARRDPQRRHRLQRRLAAAEALHVPLSARELDVLPLLDSELSIQELADRLGISYHTAKTHVRSIYAKLGASTRTAALRAARAAGLLDA